MKGGLSDSVNINHAVIFAETMPKNQPNKKKPKIPVAQIVPLYPASHPKQVPFII